ncbi:hypothetical protein [Protofrankia symbiont of Coriaria ruscifolia]|uniref:Uncharacterized protein n=1 Tax=Candidatus Protofrankia californiensis TaxID=1839754 RepID=A0A1C3NWF4_9ACTN|nr:hypothetical protein [Protofrankia symbiont of Coriaria ruscifolia]SBW20924.1 hypothetical protein FDG2_1842 [Candidatus Protofrankia californiensis]
MDKQPAGGQHPRPTSRVVVDMVRAVRGWVVAVAGGVLLFGCYLGVSAETDPGRQLPYFASGGLGGLALVFLGSALLIADQIDAASKGRGRLDRQVDELHTLIVAAASAPVSSIPAAATEPAAGSHDDGSLFAVPAGRTYHRRTCEMIASKPAQPVDPDQIAARGLTPCTICEPKIDA